MSVNNLLKTLFPITRSITGKGNEKTLEILKDTLPSLKIKSIESGTDAYDWKVPSEWNVRSAWIEDEDRNRVIDFSNNNVHLVSYSEPIDTLLSFDELKPHLHYIKNKRNAIPYRTSYYKKTWGFCLSYDQYLSLDRTKKYHVKIDSEFDEKGKMVYGEAYKKGKSKNEILISSYICHPSLANDNLSGVVLSCLLFKYLMNIETEYSYRLLLIPETIGAIAWLSQNKVNNIVFGLVPTCVAGPDKIGHKKTFVPEHELDIAIQFALDEIDHIQYEFEPIGSDERQYSSPAFKIPIASITKSKYYEYDEYHTSLDNLDFISPENLEQTLEVYKKTIYYLENNIVYSRKFDQCEFMLSKIENLYPTMGGTICQPSIVDNHKEHEYTASLKGNIFNCFSWLMHCVDGKTSLFDIQKKSNLPIDDLIISSRVLYKKGLLI